MSDAGKVNRRTFMITTAWTASVVGIGAGVGWLSTRYRSLTQRRKTNLFDDERFTYDIDKYRKTDPNLVLYKEVQQFSAELERPKAIAIGPDDRCYVAGDKAIKIYDRAGRAVSSITLNSRPHALCIDQAGQVHVVFRRHLETFDAEGKQIAKHAPLGDRTWLTSIAVTEDAIYLADGGSREIVHCNLEGEVIGYIGRSNESPGFVVPSAFFEVAVAPDGILHVANPGRLRIDAYTPQGEYLRSWGKASLAIDGFAGCCNPSNFTLLADGSFVTSEKGLNRVKIYSPSGVFRGVVAGTDHLVTDLDQANKACENCHIGFSMPVAADSAGRILILDPATQAVRVFELLPG